jgi:hypothetical protein
MEDSSNTHMIAWRFAPIVHFHPEEGAFCCYPSDAEEVYEIFHEDWNLFVEDKSPKELIPSAPCYYEFWKDEKLTQIRYWFY